MTTKGTPTTTTDPTLSQWLTQYADRAHVAPAEAERMREAAGRLEGPREVVVDIIGPGVAVHNMPCARCHTKKAVLNLDTGTFQPCWPCQAMGFSLRGRGWLAGWWAWLRGHPVPIGPRAGKDLCDGQHPQAAGQASVRGNE